MAEPITLISKHSNYILTRRPCLLELKFNYDIVKFRIIIAFQLHHKITVPRLSHSLLTRLLLTLLRTQNSANADTGYAGRRVVLQSATIKQIKAGGEGRFRVGGDGDTRWGPDQRYAPTIERLGDLGIDSESNHNPKKGLGRR